MKSILSKIHEIYVDVAFAALRRRGLRRKSERHHPGAGDLLDRRGRLHRVSPHCFLLGARHPLEGDALKKTKDSIWKTSTSPTFAKS